MKHCLLYIWHGMDQSIIDNAVDERLGCEQVMDTLSDFCNSINIHSAVREKEFHFC